MIQLVNWSKTPLSPDYRGAGSFATFMIIGGKSSSPEIPTSPGTN